VPRTPTPRLSENGLNGIFFPYPGSQGDSTDLSPMEALRRLTEALSNNPGVIVKTPQRNRSGACVPREALYATCNQTFSAIHSILSDEKSCFQPRLLLQELAIVKNSCTQGHSKLKGTRRVMALAFSVLTDLSGKSLLGETLHWGMKAFLRRRYIGVHEERAVQERML
jgi:hypothetical protein